MFLVKIKYLQCYIIVVYAPTSEADNQEIYSCQSLNELSHVV